MKIQKTRILGYLFNLTTLFAFLVLFIVSLTSRKAMTDLFSRASYYLILLMFILWAAQAVLFVKTLNVSLVALLKKYWPGFLTALVMTSFVFSSVKVGFKTLSDETNLLSISMSMLNDKTCWNVTMGKYYYGNLNPINHELEKRPLVFPFMEHLLHTLTGFRYQNAFILNFIVMFLLLSGIYIIARKFLDVPSAIAAMFLVLSYPVITVFGTSGGFDLLNSAFFVMIMAAACYFVKNPLSGAFSFIFVSLLVFANIRYESMVFLFVVPLLLIRKIKWQHLKDSAYLLFAAPLVNLPYIWQRLLRPDAYQNPSDKEVFSLGNLAGNVVIFFKNIVDFKHFLPYAGFISVISVLIFIYLIVQILRKKITLEGYERHSLVVLSITVLISTTLYFCHFFGDYTHPSSARFFITLSIVFALGPVALRIFKPDAISGRNLLIFSVVCFLFYHPVAVEGRFINTLKGNRVTEHSINFLSGINDKNILIIAERPGQFTALGYGAINFSYASKNSEQILKEAGRRLFSKAFIFQEIEYQSKNPTKETALPPDYRLNSLYEVQISATEFLRISELKTPEAQN